MKFFRQIWKDLSQGENIDLYLTVVAALILSGLSLAGQTLGDKIPAITLAVLALLAITNLVNRHRFEEMLQEQLGSGFFRKSFAGTNLDEDLGKAKEIWLVGLNLSRTIMTYNTLLDDHLAQGKKLKILLMNPDSPAVDYATRIVYYKMTTEDHRQKIRQTISHIKQISLGKESGLELRVIDHPLPFGAKATNLKTKGSKIYVNTYEYRTKSDGVRFILTSRDEYWYELYRDQIFALWRDGKPYEE